MLIEQLDKKLLERNLGKVTAGSLLMKPDALDDWDRYARVPALQHQERGQEPIPDRSLRDVVENDRDSAGRSV